MSGIPPSLHIPRKRDSVETNNVWIGCSHQGLIERPAGTKVPFSKERPDRRSRNLFPVIEALFNLPTQ